MPLAMTPSGSRLSLNRDWEEVRHEVASELPSSMQKDSIDWEIEAKGEDDEEEPAHKTQARGPNPNPNPDPDPQPNTDPHPHPHPHPHPNPNPIPNQARGPAARSRPDRRARISAGYLPCLAYLAYRAARPARACVRARTALAGPSAGGLGLSPRSAAGSCRRRQAWGEATSHRALVAALASAPYPLARADAAPAADGAARVHC